MRDYDPALGRFVSTDPLKGDMTDPQRRNRYGYALNNPLTVYDLSGLIPGQSWVEERLSDWQNGVEMIQDDPSVLASIPGYVGEDIIHFTRGAGAAGKDTFQWFYNAGDEYRHYGSDDIRTQNLMDSPGVEKARQIFYERNRGMCGCDSNYEPLSDYAPGFGPKGLYEATLDPIEQFVGGFNIDVEPIDNGRIRLRVRNTTDWYSALYHIPGVPEPDRSFFPWGGKMTQHYTWTEANNLVPCL